MKRKSYHKFEIVGQSPVEGGWIIGVDPIDLKGPFGLPDEIYELLCSLSKCVVCGKRVESLGHHLDCVRDQDPSTDYFRGVAFTRSEGRLGFFISQDAYREQFLPVYDRGWQDRQRNTRALRLARNGGSHTVKEVCVLLKCQQNRCYYCFDLFDENGEGGFHFHQDHMLAVAGGGSDDIENIVLTCAACNMEKGGEDWDSFLARRAQRLIAPDCDALLAMQRVVDAWKRGLPRKTTGAVSMVDASSASKLNESPAFVRQVDGGSIRILTLPNRAMKLALCFAPFHLARESLQRRIEPVCWKNLSAAARRASSSTCFICRQHVRSKNGNNLLVDEDWVYAHASRPATARLEGVRCICSSCYSARHIDLTRRMVEIGVRKKRVLDDAISHFCKVNACDPSTLDELERQEMEMRRRNMRVVYEVAWGRFEPLLGARSGQEHPFEIVEGKITRLEIQRVPGPLVGRVPMPIPDGWAVVHVVPLFEPTHSSGEMKSARISALLAIDGTLSSFGELSAQAWRRRKYSEFCVSAQRELAKRGKMGPE